MDIEVFIFTTGYIYCNNQGNEGKKKNQFYNYNEFFIDKI